MKTGKNGMEDEALFCRDGHVFIKISFYRKRIERLSALCYGGVEIRPGR